MKTHSNIINYADKLSFKMKYSNLNSKRVQVQPRNGKKEDFWIRSKKDRKNMHNNRVKVTK